VRRNVDKLVLDSKCLPGHPAPELKRSPEPLAHLDSERRRTSSSRSSITLHGRFASEERACFCRLLGSMACTERFWRAAPAAGWQGATTFALRATPIQRRSRSEVRQERHRMLDDLGLVDENLTLVTPSG